MEDKSPRMLGNGRPKKPVRQKLILTEKQKSARLTNLEAGRKKRAELLKQKRMKQNEYDLSSEDSESNSNSNSSESDSDNNAFVISKKKKKPEKKVRKRSELMFAPPTNLRLDN